MNFSDYIFPAFFLVFFGTFVFRYIRNGSLTGALLGGRIKRTTGEIALSGGQFTSRVLSVHVLEPTSGEKPFVALSIVSKAPLGASMIPVKLTFAQAQQLIALLQQATGGRAT
ncbi:MAG TPA: hypothetical protein VGH80_13785 [Xanthomonadaceae bacterium]